MYAVLAPIISSILILSKSVLSNPIHVTIDIAESSVTAPHVLFPPTAPSTQVHSDAPPFFLQAIEAGGKPVIPSLFLGYSPIRIYPPRLGLTPDIHPFRLSPDEMLILDQHPVGALENGWMIQLPGGNGGPDESKLKFKIGKIDGMPGDYLIVDGRGPPHSAGEFWTAGPLRFPSSVYNCVGKTPDCTAEKTRVFFKVQPMYPDFTEEQQMTLEL